MNNVPPENKFYITNWSGIGTDFVVIHFVHGLTDFKRRNPNNQKNNNKEQNEYQKGMSSWAKNWKKNIYAGFTKLLNVLS